MRLLDDSHSVTLLMNVTICDADDVASSVTFVVVFVLQAIGDGLKQAGGAHPILKPRFVEYSKVFDKWNMKQFY